MLNFYNQTNTTVFVAIMFFDDDVCGGDYGDWRTQGWWRLAPGETKSVHSLDLFHNRYYYYYAKGNDGRVWEGTYGDVYVYSGAFDSCIDIGSTGADDVVGMRQLDIGWEITSYTLNLTG
jgi:uncharacterized membrane protein